MCNFWGDVVNNSHFLIYIFIELLNAVLFSNIYLFGCIGS